LVKIRALRVSHPCLSVRIRGLNSAFKIKSPPHTAGKIVKASRGESSVFDPRGPMLQIHPPGNAKPLIFNHFTPLHPSKRFNFTSKNRQFMTYFQCTLTIQNLRPCVPSA
jgi:hypothetical protein